MRDGARLIYPRVFDYREKMLREIIRGEGRRDW